jgi:hypothetical protein
VLPNCDYTYVFSPFATKAKASPRKTIRHRFAVLNSDPAFGKNSWSGVWVWRSRVPRNVAFELKMLHIVAVRIRGGGIKISAFLLRMGYSLIEYQRLVHLERVFWYSVFHSSFWPLQSYSTMAHWFLVLSAVVTATIPEPRAQTHVTVPLFQRQEGAHADPIAQTLHAANKHSDPSSSFVVAPETQSAYVPFRHNSDDVVNRSSL